VKVVETSVGAVTSLNNELYVALSNTGEIHVYHADNLEFIRNIPVDGLGSQVTLLLLFVNKSYSIFSFQCRFFLVLNMTR